MPGPETFVGQRRTALFDEQRPRLLGLAYRMLGAVSEAEAVLDVTPGAVVGRVPPRESRTPRRPSPRSSPGSPWTGCGTSRPHDTGRAGYAGSWLPEPVPCRSRDDEPMSIELLAAMERLSPLERAAYVLRVVLARPYPEVAAVLGRRLPAVRQLVRRARVHLGDAATRDPRPTAPAMRSSSAGSSPPVGHARSLPSSRSWARTSSC